MVACDKIMPNKQCSSQIMYDQPAKKKEDGHPSVEDPLVLLCSPLYHTDGVSTNAQRICYSIQPTLGAFEYFTLLTQITQYSPTTVKKFVELIRSLIEECILT